MRNQSAQRTKEAAEGGYRLSHDLQIGGGAAEITTADSTTNVTNGLTMFSTVSQSKDLQDVKPQERPQSGSFHKKQIKRLATMDKNSISDLPGEILKHHKRVSVEK